jgi:hypothetical protein
VNANATGHREPTFHRLVPSMTVAGPIPSFAKLSYSFCKNDISTTQDFIYAGDLERPVGDLDTQYTRISFHEGMYGSFTADLKQNSPMGDNNEPILNLGGSSGLIYATHGILMYIAWCISPFAGIFVSKYLKSYLGHNWFRLHILFMGVGTGLFSIASLILVILYRRPPHFFSPDALRHTHVLMGIMILLAMLLQIILGVVIDKLFNPEREKIPLRDRLHWYLGRFLAVLAIFNAYLGLTIFDEKHPVPAVIKVGFWVGLVGGISLLAFGECTFGSDHHIRNGPFVVLTEDSTENDQ